MIKNFRKCWCAILLIISLPVIAQYSIAITGATVYTKPFQDPLRNATILISKGRVSRIGPSDSLEIPQGYQVVNGKGKYVTAGYWNSHVHLIESKWHNSINSAKDSLETWLSQMFSSKGFVYVFDLAQIDFENLNALRSRVKRDKIKSPTILSVGVPFTSKSPFYIEPLSLPELNTSAEVTKHIQTQIRSRANGIKIWSASPTAKRIDYLSPALIQEASKLTKKLKIPLFAHPTNLKGVEAAIDNGVTVLAHTAPDDRKLWDSILIEKMINKNVALIPTLKLFAWELRMAGINPENNTLVNTAVEQLSVFSKAGGVILFGTDVGYIKDYDIVEELVLMTKAGMSFHQILASLTINPAKTFNLSDKTGSIEVGKDADLVLLSSDPSADVRNFCTVETTIHKGVIIYK